MTMSKSDLRNLAKDCRTKSFAAKPDLGGAIERAVNLLAHLSVMAAPLQNPSTSSVKTIGVYLPIRDEMPTQDLIKTLWHKGVPLCLPHVIGRRQPLKFYPFTPESHLSPNKFGIDEIDLKTESGASEIFSDIIPDIIFVPLLAFDRTGARLGYGQGHYDVTIKHLRSHHDIVTIGWGYESQLWPHHIPTEPHDEPLDMVITEENSYCFTKNA